jgi:hypothetical protein
MQARASLFYSVPVTLRARPVDGTIQTFVACYVLHLARPVVQSPSFRPLSIQSADVQQVLNDTDTVPLMNEACPVRGTGVPPQDHCQPASAAVR